MKICLVIGALLFTTQIIHAAEPKITETENGYIVEYSGSPDIKSNSNPDTKINLETQRAELGTELDRLKAESEEIRKRRDAARDNVESLKRQFKEDNERFKQKYEPRK